MPDQGATPNDADTVQRHYATSPAQADRLLSVLTALGLALAGVLVALGQRPPAAVLGLAVALSLLVRWRRGPLVGPPLLEWNPAALRIREAIYVPPRVQTVPIEGLRRLMIVGPGGDRRFRFMFVDGSMVEVRPWLRSAEAPAIAFIRRHLTGIEIKESEPAGIFEQVRGDY